MSAKRILVIEDERVMRENVVTLLELEGFEVVSAADGPRGLELAQASRPDLILCDVMMPGVDGYGVLQAVRENSALAHIPFIFFTAKGERPDVRQDMNLGADDYLTKPVSNHELLAAITARFERQNLLNPPKRLQPDFSSAAPLEKLGLTPREAEVLLWVARGKTNSDIGIILQCSEATAKRHVVHILEKLSVETRTAAARLALEALARLLP
ncbi:MAG: response regulator transcription factor [Verrucomicrobia bacterium]|nr:response regulator transcription factor [Verrucomicrobiota bacterium]